MRVILKIVAERQYILIQNTKNAVGRISGNTAKKILKIIKQTKKKHSKTNTKANQPKSHQKNPKEVHFTVKNRIILKSRM